MDLPLAQIGIALFSPKDAHRCLYGRCWARPSYNSVDAPDQYLSTLAATDSHSEEALKIAAVRLFTARLPPW